MSQPDNETAQSPFLSEVQWAEQEVIDHLRQSVQAQLVSLTHSEQLCYRQLVRQYATSLEDVEREDKAIKDDFETFGVQRIRERILALTGKDLDPHTTFIHTRYLHIPDRQQPFPQRLRRSPDATEEADVLPEPQAYIDERTPVAHVLSMSLWQAACMNFGFLSYFASFRSDSLVNASFINHTPGIDFRYAQVPERINTDSLISVQTFIDVARSLDLGAELKTRINRALSEDGSLDKLLLANTKAHVQFCLMELYRTCAADAVMRARVKALSVALDSTPNRLKVRQIIMTIKFTRFKSWFWSGIYVTPGNVTASKPAPEQEIYEHHVSIPLFQISNRDDHSVFSFFPGRPNGELRWHANERLLIADFRDLLIKARAEKRMDWFKAHLTAECYEKLTAVVPEPVGPGHFVVTGQLPRIKRDWIDFEPLGFKPLSTQTSLEEATVTFQSGLYLARLSQLASERSAQDWADLVSAISTLFEELSSLLLIPVPGATKGLTRAIQFLFVGTTASGLYSALEQAGQGDSSGLAQSLVDAMDLLITPKLNASAARLARSRHAKLLQGMGQPRTYTRIDGSTALWASDPAHFVKAPAAVTDHLQLDEQGIYRQAGRDYALIEKNGEKYVFEVERNLDGTWRAIAKTDPASFRPPVVWDATQRRWQLALDDSPALSDVQLLRRMVRGMTAEAARIALSISAVSRADLQRVWQGGLAPASLTEAIIRFQADTQLQRCTDELRQYEQSSTLTERSALALMPQLDYWPSDVLLLVSDHQGGSREVYGQYTGVTPLPQPLILKRLDDGELVLSGASLLKAFKDDLLTGIIKKLSLPTDKSRMAQKLAAHLSINKGALFNALTVNRDHLPASGLISSSDLAYLPMEHGRKIPAIPLIRTLLGLHPGLSLERCSELQRRYPAFGDYAAYLHETLHRRINWNAYRLPETLYSAVKKALFSARLERLLDAVYHPRPFNPDVDQWLRDLCTLIIKHRYKIDVVIVASPKGVTDTATGFIYSDTELVLSDLGGGLYAAYDRKRHLFLPPLHGPDSFFAALVTGLAQPSRNRHQPGHNALTVEGWRTLMVETLAAYRTPDGFINAEQPRVDSYALPELKWSSTARPDAKGIYRVDDVPSIVLDRLRYEVQSATDGLTNWIIDSSRFGRVPIAILGNGCGGWRHQFENPMKWDGDALFLRLGHRAAGFDSDQIAAIMRASGTTEEMLRRVHVNREPIPPLLADTLQRLTPPERLEIADQPLDPSVEMMKRVYPDLSTVIATDLVRSANDLEVRQMKDGRVPLRLAEEARWYQREVRVNRAIEGLYVPALQNNDSVKLMLHGLSKQPGWPATVSVEVRDGRVTGPLIGQLGPDNAAVQLTCLKTAQGWQAWLASEQATIVWDLDLFSALLATLPTRERGALGFSHAGGVALLKEQVTLRVVEHRDQLFGVLGMIAKRPWFSPPTRLADGRVGYLLSGRGSATDRFFADKGLRERYESIYPATVGGESSQAIQRMRVSNLDIDAELTRLETEARMLSSQLAEWQNQPADFEAHYVGAEGHKYGMSQALIKAWRKETPLINPNGSLAGYRLELQDWRVPTLPVLGADFSHITHLNMQGLRLGSVDALGGEENINQFLRTFKSLTSLRIQFCALTRFPTAIEALPNLVTLSLSRNFIRLDLTEQHVLAGLVHLRHLNLHRCVLNGRLDVTRLTELQELILSSTETVTWPLGVMQLTHLTRLDLSDNHIVAVPPEVLNGPGVDAINRVTSLLDNPLARLAERQLEAYEARTRIRFGLHPRGNHPPRMAFDTELWLSGLDAHERAAMHRTFDLLRDAPEAERFFKVIEDLKTTADFERAKQDVVHRVQRMLKAAAEDKRVRGLLFAMTSEPRLCCDSLALLFSRLETQVLVSRALADDDPARAELSLARLIRGNFRLSELDRLAVVDARNRGGNVDELEIAFTYRLALSEALQLPAQPQAMKFAMLGIVEPGAIERAKVAILAMNNSESMLDYMAHDPFWDKFLRARYADQFGAVYDASHTVVAGQDVYDSERYARELKALQNTLTLAALARL